VSDDDPFILSDGDKRNPLWLSLKEHFELKLKNARGKNDGALEPFRPRRSAVKSLLGRRFSRSTKNSRQSLTAEYQPTETPVGFRRAT
jgi:hypothetical protein